MLKKPKKTEVIDGVTFELRPFVRNSTNPAWVCLRKTQTLVNRYRTLASNFRACRMVEVGVDQGGGTSFFLKLFKPRQLLAIELSDEPVPRLMDFLEEHDKERCVDVRWGIDQADSREVPRIVDEVFDGSDLDIVVDDASHLLPQTTATFEMLFPRLRPGGVYVIEDWSTDHLMEARFAAELAANPDGDLAERAANTPVTEYEMPMSFLICQLLIASARNPQLIPSLNIGKSICEIRRGTADIEPGTPISDYIGNLGQWMLHC